MNFTGHHHLSLTLHPHASLVYIIRGCAVSGHYFSPDGMTWAASPNAPYGNHVDFTDGSSMVVSTRERPKLVFDSAGGYWVGMWVDHDAVSLDTSAVVPSYAPCGSTRSVARTNSRLHTHTSPSLPSMRVCIRCCACRHSDSPCERRVRRHLLLRPHPLRQLQVQLVGLYPGRAA